MDLHHRFFEFSVDRAFRARRGKRVFRLAGATLCLFAIFLTAGGHWALLQSFAYTRMLVEFAQENSWCTAVKKTFDDRYACSLCPKIRGGFSHEQKAGSRLAKMQQQEFIVQSSGSVFFSPSIVADVPFVPSRHLDFFSAPPKPPPRAA